MRTHSIARQSCLQEMKFSVTNDHWCTFSLVYFSFYPQEAENGIHVCHAVIDGMVDMPIINQFMPDAPAGRLIDPDAVAEAYWGLYKQPKTCFTFEIDIRPHLAEW